MRRTLFLAAVVALAACGGDDGGGSQPQTEEAAVEATVRSVEGTLRNNSGDVLRFLNDECRASVDDDEVRDALLFAQLLFQSDEYDIGDIEVTGTATDFTGDTATIAIELDGPEGVDLGLLELGSDEIDVVYENDRWVGEDCDFEDTTANDEEALQEDLDALGLAGTQDDPVPGGVVAPVGAGFSVRTVDFVDDAFDLITEEGGFEPFIDEGEQIALLELEVGFTGGAEPARLGQLDIQLVGADGVALSQTSCGTMPSQIAFGSAELFTGGATTGVSCFSGPPASFPTTPIVSIDAVFGERSVFFSPTAAGDGGGTMPSVSGPSPDGDLTDDRTSPASVGTAVDLGEGWTMTVDGIDTDVAATGDFDRPPPDGFAYVLLGVTLGYDGEESSAGAFQVDIGLVGDSNVGRDASCDLNDVPDRLDTFADVFQGGTISGNLCVTVDAADVDSLVAYATADSFDDDREFFAVR